MRGFGRNVVQICAYLDLYGPAGSKQMAEHFGIRPDYASIYCRRALVYELVTVVKPEKRSAKNFSIYTVAPDWKQRLKKGKVNEPKPTKTGVSSVWELGHWPGSASPD